MNGNLHFAGKRGKAGATAALALLSVIFVVMWISAFQWSNYLMVAEIIVEGQKIVSREEILRLAGVSLHSRLDDVDLAAVQKNIRRNQFIKNAVVRREAPASLHITVEERKPVAVLMAGRFEPLTIDAEGYLMPHLTLFDLPVISGVTEGDLNVGEQTHRPEVLTALELITVSQDVDPELSHIISEIHTDGTRDMVLYSSDSGLPIIVSRENVAKQLVKLDAFWKKFVLEEGSENFRYIDLRFEDRVVVLTATPS